MVGTQRKYTRKKLALHLEDDLHSSRAKYGAKFV